MKKFRAVILATVYLTWIFWPWMLGIVEAVRWFLHMPFFHQWEPDRIGMAVLWPLPAFVVFIFLVWVYSSATE